jgi:hypothetical protein
MRWACGGDHFGMEVMQQEVNVEAVEAEVRVPATSMTRGRNSLEWK